MTAEHEKFLLTQQLAKATAQLEAIKRGSSATSPPASPPLGGLPNSSSFVPDLIPHHQFIKQESLDEYPYNMPTPQHSHGVPSSSYSSPSAPTYSETSTPVTMGLDLDALNASSDMTQHPAAMLCDLPCQSPEACQTATQPMTRHAVAIQSFMANLVYLMLTSAVYLQLMDPQRMIFISSRTGSPLPPSMMTTPTVSSLIQWLISTPANLLLPSLIRTMTSSLSAKKISPAKALSTLEVTHSRTLLLRLRLLQRLLLSSPSMARPLRAATGRALRPKTGSMTSKMGVRGLSVRRVARNGEKAGLGQSVRSMARGDRMSGSTWKKRRSQKVTRG